MPSRRMRQILPWASVALFVGLAAGAGWLGTAEQASSAAVARADFTLGRNQWLTRFAGYDDVGTGPFTEIGAEWEVPRVPAGSPPGAASEWVGLASTASGAFIQIGTKEIVGGGETAVRYRAVWSDTRLDFEAQPFLVVDPGDVVESTMSRTPGGWRLRFTDRTRSRSVDFVVRYAARTVFTTAEWMEEDSSGPFSTNPFPRLAPLTYRELRLNAEELPLGGTTLEPAILQAPNRIDVVPTQVHRDSFTNREPSGRIASLVDAVAPFDIAFEDFVTDWAQSAQASDPTLYPTPAVTPRTTSAIAGSVARYFSSVAVSSLEDVLRTTRRLREQLARPRVPAEDRPLVSGLLQDATAAAADLESAAATDERSRSWTVRELHDGITECVQAGRQLRRLIDLPG